MTKFILIFLGSGLGGMLRYALSGWVLHHTMNWKFPLGTFIVNVAGCLAAGVIAGLIIKQEMISPSARLFLLTGVLGGFTTFSAFGIECMYLLRRGEWTVAALYVLLSVAVCIGGLMLVVRLTPGQVHQP
jgi:fluoride exporter